MARTVISRRLFATSVYLAFVLLATAVSQVGHAASTASFTAGSIVIYRVGDGVAGLTSAAQTVFLDEYSPGGALRQSVPLPAVAAGANKRLVASGTATSEGLLTASADGRYLIVTGYDAAPGTAGIAATSTAAGAGQVLRVIGRVDADGNVDTSTTTTDFSANNIRGASSTDGTSFWATGAAGGVRYGLLGASGSLTAVSTTVTNLRSTHIFAGQLYVSTSSGSAVRVGTVGTGTPTTAGNTTANLPGFPTAGSPYGFFFADLDGTPGVDTLYVASDDAGGLTKYALTGGTWVAKGTIGVTADAYRGVTGTVSGSTVTLYATRKGGSGATGGGELVSLVDASGFNGAFGGTPTLLATAGANKAFRGIALAPRAGQALPTVTIGLSTSTASEASATAVTVTATTSAPVVGDQSVSVAVSGTGVTSGDYTISSAVITIPDGLMSGTTIFTVVDDGDFEGSETATLTLTGPSTGLAIGSPAAADLVIVDNDAAPPACTIPAGLISTVQGSGATSPVLGATVTVRGIVVGDNEGPSPALRGFYLQDGGDGDPATSDGIFVFEGSNANAVSLGDVVQVTGVAQEFQGQTQIGASSVESCGTTGTVTPVALSLPVPAAVGGLDYLERFEGMLVRFPQTLTVTEHFQLGRFGQIVMSSNGRLPQPTHYLTPGAQAQTQQAVNDLNRLIVDDETNAENPDPIRFGRNGNPLTALNTLRGGDTATNILGVMTYTWAGNSASGNAYRLRPVNALAGGVPSFVAANPRPSGPPAVGGRLKVASFNVLNYFLTLDNGGSNCGQIGNRQACRGAETALELSRQQQKLTQALRKLNADVVGLMELENTQTNAGADVNPLADIVARLNAVLGGPVYDYINTGVIGSDAIRVGIIYKPTSLAVAGATLIDTNPVHNRPSVAQTFTEIGTGERFTLVVNHLKSKGSCPAGGVDSDLGDGQDCWNATRVAQAQALLSFVNTNVIPAAGDPDVLLIGDFNSYAKEDPITAFIAGGFTNTIAAFHGDVAYSYVFDGQWGYLDHALASGNLAAQVTGADHYDINADEPSALDYNTNFKTVGQQGSLFNADEFRTSDHNPVVIGLALRPAPKATNDSAMAEAGMPLAGGSVLFNDAGGALTIVSHTNPAHGALLLKGDGTYIYRPAAGFTGSDTFTYSVSNAVQLFASTIPSLDTIDGVELLGDGFGSALTAVPGVPGEYFGLTDRGPNADGPGGIKVAPTPTFNPRIGRFRFADGEAMLLQTILLTAPDGSPYSGRVNKVGADAAIGVQDVMTDLGGNVLPTDPNGYDPEGLVALADGSFWISDEYGPFITKFDLTGKQVQRLSPFDGTLPRELAYRVTNRGMEGLTVTPDGLTLVGMMQSSLQQDDLGGFDAKKLTPLRIVTYRLADGATHEYLYLLDNPNTTKTAVSEITALSNTTFLVLERDSSYPPAYKRLFLIDLAGATDVGPAGTVPGAAYDASHGGLLVGGKTLENLLRSGSTPQDTVTSAATLAAAGITPVAKQLYFDVSATLLNLDPAGHFFAHDKMEGVSILDGGRKILISNDNDFGIDGVITAAPPFSLHAKATPAGVIDRGEFLLVDLDRLPASVSTATVTIAVTDSSGPETTLISTPTNPSTSDTATFQFSGSDVGIGVAGFECSLDGGAYAACASPVTYSGLGAGNHTFAVRAHDAAGNVDSTPTSYTWEVSLGAPKVTVTLVGQTPRSSGQMTVTLRVSSTGLSNARDVRFDTIVLRTLSGSGTVTVLSPAVPTALGTIPAGQSVNVVVTLGVPATVSRFTITENGSLANAAGSTTKFSAAHPVVP